MEAEIIKSIIVWVITAVLGSLLTYYATKYKKATKENCALKNGIQSLLRNDIIDKHDKWTERGYCPIYVKEAITKSYEAYHALGGNGVVTKLYNDIIELPEEPPKEK